MQENFGKNQSCIQSEMNNTSIVDNNKSIDFNWTPNCQHYQQNTLNENTDLTSIHQYNQQVGIQFNQNMPEQQSKQVESEQSNFAKKKVKKSRILFSQWQINELEKLFKKQKYLTTNERELMAKRLKLHANQVKIWFQNRRYKIKKRSETIKD